MSNNLRNSCIIRRVFNKVLRTTILTITTTQGCLNLSFLPPPTGEGGENQAVREKGKREEKGRRREGQGEQKEKEVKEERIIRIRKREE